MDEGGKTLAEYLGVVRQAILAGLEMGDLIHSGTSPPLVLFGPYLKCIDPLSIKSSTD